MGWADTRAKLLGEASPAEPPSESLYPLAVRWASEKGVVAVRDPWGEWHDMEYRDLTPVWKRALRGSDR